MYLPTHLYFGPFYCFYQFNYLNIFLSSGFILFDYQSLMCLDNRGLIVCTVNSILTVVTVLKRTKLPVAVIFTWNKKNCAGVLNWCIKATASRHKWRPIRGLLLQLFIFAVPSNVFLKWGYSRHALYTEWLEIVFIIFEKMYLYFD